MEIYMQPQSRISMQLLRHTAYYVIETDEGQVHIQFRAEIGYNSFFKVPVARFVWPDKSVYEISVEPFTANLLYKDGKKPPFDVEYSNGAWYAPLRPRP